MKRIIFSIFIAAAVAFGSVFELAFVGERTDICVARIKKIDDLVRENDRERALEECKRLENEWDENVRHIDILLIHDYADSVGADISKMRAHLENGNTSMYFSESAGAKKGLASIKGSEYPFIENIL